MNPTLNDLVRKARMKTTDAKTVVGRVCRVMEDHPEYDAIDAAIRRGVRAELHEQESRERRQLRERIEDETVTGTTTRAKTPKANPTRRGPKQMAAAAEMWRESILGETVNGKCVGECTPEYLIPHLEKKKNRSRTERRTIWRWSQYLKVTPDGEQIKDHVTPDKANALLVESAKRCK